MRSRKRSHFFNDCDKRTIETKKEDPCIEGFALKLAIAMFAVLSPISQSAKTHHIKHHHKHHIKHHSSNPYEGMQTAIASYYNYEGIACPGGWQTLGYAQGIDGVIHSYWPCGTRTRFCYLSRCVIGVRQDSGPYILGRTFDLTPGLKGALGCSDVCTLYWRRL